MPRLVAIYRSATYSPNQHKANDTAILDEVVARLELRGWTPTRLGELDVQDGRLERAELYLNMCQGAAASEQLVPFEAEGFTLVNRASSVLNCHRHRLVRTLAGHSLAFPETAILPTTGGIPDDATLHKVAGDQDRVWLKRGDVHAERTEDVLSVRPADLGGALRTFAERRIGWAAIQRHVPGPVLKFYGVADGSFFRYYAAELGPDREAPPVNLAALQSLAFRAAEILGLEVFGGDVAVPAPDHPVLIDINDWPSFAPFRDDAARAIAAYITHRFAHRKHS
jgi:hypothetical protein